MPTISVEKARLYFLLGKSLSDAELESLCFDFGLEAEADLDNALNIKVEVPANRHDLLAVEGLAHALGLYLGLAAPLRHARAPATTFVVAEESVGGVRPFVAAGILRNIKFDQSVFQSFIDFQEKLQQNLGRRRALVSMGTHDLNKIEAPFSYSALPRAEVAFKALNQSEELSAETLFARYRDDQQLKAYVPLLENAPLLPVVRDGRGRILSLPPIINSEFSRVELTTRDVLVEVTSTDRRKGETALTLFLANFSRYCDPPFVFEAVETRANGEARVPPSLTRSLLCAPEYLERLSGVSATPSEICANLLRMGYISAVVEEGNVKVEVPPFRADILHSCDVAEDLAIAVGYNRIPNSEPQMVGCGRQQPLNAFAEAVRGAMAAAGYLECLNFSLCAAEDIGARLLRPSDPRAVVIANPKTSDFVVARTTLIPGLLKALAANKASRLPLRVFELGDVVRLGDDGERGEGRFGEDERVGACNFRHIAFAYTSVASAGLDAVHGTLDLLVQRLLPGRRCALAEGGAAHFFGQLQARVLVEGECVGEMGIAHPEVLAGYQWPFPVSLVELDFGKLLRLRTAVRSD